MSNNLRKRKQEERRRAWIYTRYLFPILSLLLILGSLALPCLRYVTADTGTNDSISSFELLQNSWDQVRVYLFGTAASEQLPENVAFCETVLVLLVVLVLLFLVVYIM